MPPLSGRLLRLGVIATAAGAFSGLFGVLAAACHTLYGNRLLSPVGVLLGVVLANVVSERVLELSFAGVRVLFAWQLAKRAGLR